VLLNPKVRERCSGISENTSFANELATTIAMNIRLFTAIALIGICGVAVARGGSIVHFSLVVANADSPQKRSELSNTWRSVANVGSAALRPEVAEPINISDPKAASAQREAVSSLLAIEPMSSIDWLSVSGLQLFTDQPMEQVFASLELSTLTGPNEGYVMPDRGIYGVSLWHRLAPDLQRRVVADLAVDEYPDIQKIRGFLATQPEEVRNEIREALLASGVSPQEVEKRVSF
jgi:hypothetical protein